MSRIRHAPSLYNLFTLLNYVRRGRAWVRVVVRRKIVAPVVAVCIKRRDGSTEWTLAMSARHRDIGNPQAIRRVGLEPPHDAIRRRLGLRIPTRRARRATAAPCITRP